MEANVRRSRLYIVGSLCMAVGSAALLPFGCGEVANPNGCAEANVTCEPPIEVGGNGGAGGSGGGGAAGASGRGGNAGGAGAGGSAGDTPDSGSEIVCGGIAGLVCPDSMYCSRCNTDQDQSGVCKPRPDACSKECTGACGCDGMFYCSVCEAQRAGVQASEGPCPDSGHFEPTR